MTEWNRCVSDAFSRNVGMLEFHATKRIWLYKWFQSFSIQVQKTSVGNHPIPRLGRRQPPCTMNPTGTHVCSYLSLWVHQPWIFDMPIIMSWHVMSCTVMWCDAMVCLYVRTYVRMYVINIHVIYIYMQRLGVAPALQRRGFPFPIKCCCNLTFNWEDQQRY